MTKAEEAAQWMWDEIQREGTLWQSAAVIHIVNEIRGELTYANENGQICLHPSVLMHFKRLHRGKAKWQVGPFPYGGYWTLKRDK